jgi:hypothetical protein
MWKKRRSILRLNRLRVLLRGRGAHPRENRGVRILFNPEGVVQKYLVLDIAVDAGQGGDA